MNEASEKIQKMARELVLKQAMLTERQIESIIKQLFISGDITIFLREGEDNEVFYKPYFGMEELKAKNKRLRDALVEITLVIGEVKDGDSVQDMLHRKCKKYEAIAHKAIQEKSNG